MKGVFAHVYHPLNISNFHTQYRVLLCETDTSRFPLRHAGAFTPIPSLKVLHDVSP